VNYNISNTVREHIPKKDIKQILKDDHIAIHFIDLNDHFQHQDSSITRINFLQYSDKDWQKIAGNEFAYCNCLRATDYLALFRKSGFNVCRKEALIDDETRVSMGNGFMVD